MTGTDPPRGLRGRAEDRALRLLDAALAALPGAQAREGQRRMAAAVAGALADREHLLVQAGTGTGKSLGYLVPALASGRRVVVATATKALQAQLVDEDLPRLVDALTPEVGRRLTYALAKGRGNYLCLQQLHGGPGAVADEQEELFAPAPASALGRTVVRLREWADDTGTGDRDEVPFPVDDRAWRQVSVSARDCLGGRCPDRARCFAEKAREEAADADVVVANHALLALDAFTTVSVLPEHDAVVLDEAHEFGAAATDALSAELADRDLRRVLSACRDLVPGPTADRLADAGAALEGLLATTPAGLLRALPTHAAEVLALVEAAAGAAARDLGPGRDDRAERDDVEQAQRDRARTLLSAVAEAARELRAPSRPSAVYAVPDGSTTRLRASPLRVGGAVAAVLLGERTVVATSATLTLGGSFRHAARSLGLAWLAGRPLDEDGEPHDGRDPAAVAEVVDGDGAGPGPAEEDPPPRWAHLDVGSPFDHPRQGQLWVADRLPDPARSPRAWAAAVDETLVALVGAAGGRTLGLFSSTAAAARAAAVVRAALDVPVLLQGEDAPGALRHAFAADARTCLFGTRSFWQGVDTPGSACQLVVIDRIPFGHVDDPLAQARLADAAASGRNGFLEVTLPPAAVLLAQGAGRLLRAADDRGVVAVLDPRLATASYAGLLRATLPPFWPARDLDGVLASLRAIDAAAPPVRAVGAPPAQRRAARAARSRAPA